jgi:hypothetical protein
MRTSTIVMIGILGLAATPLALHLVGGSTGSSKNWIKTLHGGSATASMHGGRTGSGVPEVPPLDVARGALSSSKGEGSGADHSAQDKKPAPKPAAATLAGKWTVTIESDQGNVTSTMVLKQEGRNVTGTFSNPHGEGTLPVVGELADRALTLSVDAVVDHGEMHLAFKGAMKDDGSLAGTMTSAMGDSKWTAVRIKDKD